MGIDVHFVTIPPAPAPVIMPYPYIGRLLNPKDFIAIKVESLIPAPPPPPEPGVVNAESEVRFSYNRLGLQSSKGADFEAQKTKVKAGYH